MLLTTTSQRSASAALPKGLISALFALCGMSISGVSLASGDTLLDFQAGAFHDSNLTRAQDSADIRADRAAAVSASVGKYFALTGTDGLTLTIAVRSEVFDRYSGLSHVDIGAGGTYRHKFGLGFDAPWIVIWSVFFGWMAVWGGIEIAYGLSIMLESKARLRLMGLTGKETAVEANRQQSLSGGESPKIAASALRSTPRSVTEATTRHLDEPAEK